MSLALSGADVGHLAVVAGITCARGFERAVRGAAAGDRATLPRRPRATRRASSS